MKHLAVGGVTNLAASVSFLTSQVADFQTKDTSWEMNKAKW